MQKFRVGVIGFGWVAGAHIEAIQATGQADVVAVCSSRPLDERGLEARFHTPIQAVSQIDALLALDVDVVSICSYPYQHPEHVRAVAAAGKHLIIEKPLALDLAGLRSLESAVTAAGVKTCVCFECRYSSQFLTTRAMIDRGLLGTVHYGEVDYYHGIGPWYGQYRWNTRRDAGGSSLLSAGCHAMDALLLCMGGVPESVTSYSTRSASDIFQPYEYDTTSVSIVRFTDGRVGKTTSCIDCLQPYYFHTHLVGSEGSLLDDRFYSRTLGGLNGLKKDRWSQLGMSLMDSGDVSDHPYQVQFAAFFESLRNHQVMPLTSLSDAIRTHELIFAADLSAKERRPVMLSEVQR